MPGLDQFLLETLWMCRKMLYLLGENADVSRERRALLIVLSEKGKTLGMNAEATGKI